MVNLTLPKSVPSLKAVTALLEKMPFLKRDKGGSHMRAHQRHPAVIVAELLIADKGFKIDGLVIEVSRGGIRFREASNYILDRRGTTVVVIVGDKEFPGSIVNVGTNGYGIKLDTLIPEDEVDRLMTHSLPQPN